MESKAENILANVECISCQDEIPMHHTGIRCPRGHHLCQICTSSYMVYIVGNPKVYAPAKCSHTQCKQEIDFNYIDINCSEDQAIEYLKYSIYNQERYQRMRQIFCSDCEYFEYWENENISNLFICKNPECGRITCQICGDSIHYQKRLQNINSKEEELSYAKFLECISKFGCSKHMKEIMKITNIIKKDGKRYCSHCNQFCNVIIDITSCKCSKCSKIFCSICGKPEEICEKLHLNGDMCKHDDNIMEYFMQIFLQYLKSNKGSQGTYGYNYNVGQQQCSFGYNQEYNQTHIYRRPLRQEAHHSYATAASTLPQSVPPPADPVHMINQMPPAPLSTQQKPPVNTQSSIYANKVKSIFTSAEFSSLSEEARREKIGEEIYNYVLQKVGEESAPKITGMIIDLPYQDFITSVQSWEGLQEKIQEGLDLLMDDE